MGKIFTISEKTLYVNAKEFIKESFAKYVSSDLKSETLIEYVNNAIRVGSFTSSNVKSVIECTKKFSNEINEEYSNVILLRKVSSRTDGEIGEFQMAYSSIYKSFENLSSEIFNVNPVHSEQIKFSKLSELKEIVNDWGIESGSIKEKQKNYLLELKLVDLSL